ncbi:MAG: M61 family metallopeptidase [Gemmatimonadetes bacterium]|nr:M61 family metallopeptidase [Gemmatimonadota bacterium]
MKPKTIYHLALADRTGKHFEVTLTVRGVGGSPFRLTMPSWIPGSYLMREYAGHVSSVRADVQGQPAPVTKLDKGTWEVDPGGSDQCVVTYRVYAPELSVRTNDISDDHAFVNPAGTFLMVEGRQQEPSRLTVDLPPGWHACTSLLGDPKTGYEVPDYDVLVDSPLELGMAAPAEFEAAGVTHQWVTYGSGNLDQDRVLRDTRRIIETEVDLFGELPVDRYLFILHLTPERGGGLEHCHSSVLAWPKLKFRPEKEYRKFLTLIAHEYFHLWNVKRIRPEALLTFDYSQEVYTRLLWVFEGITSYYDQIVPLRAGVYETPHYLEFLAERMMSERRKPGRDRMSLAESSFDTWIKLYRPNPDSHNTQISYYEKGELAALTLDLHLRRETDGKRSLDDVMRALYHDVYKQGRGLAEDGFASIVRAATGVDRDQFLHELVHGTGEFPIEQMLSAFGLRVAPKDREDDDGGAWMGVAVTTGPTSSTLGHVADGRPAHRGGLMPGDEIVALDGHRVRADLTDRLKLYQPGETVRWTAFRRDRQVEGSITFAADPCAPVRIVPVDDVDDVQREQFAGWTHVAWAVAFPDDAESPENVTA